MIKNSNQENPNNKKGYELSLSSLDVNEFLSELKDDPDRNGLNDSKMPKISVVIPSLNQSKFFEKSVLSILNQNYPNIEIIVVDGGSEDDTLSVVKKYEKYIAVWASEKGISQVNALNRGFERATGDIFAWLNISDIYLPGAFREVARIFIDKPKIMVCYGNWCSIDEFDTVICPHYALKPRLPHAPYENIDAYNQSMFWRRSVHERFGKFDENLNQAIDLDMIIRFLINEKISNFYKTKSFLGAFRQHYGQKTSIEKMRENDFLEEQYLEKKFGFYPSGSIIGKYFRLKYRCAQCFESVAYGGMAYTWKKFITTYNRRGRFI